MLRRAISTLLLVVGTVVGMGQTPKTATVKGYSPALKDNTQVICFVNNASAATDSVRDGHFTLTVPVEKLTQADIVLRGEGCSHYSLDFYLKPGITVNITDTNCLFPLWKVESPLPEQKTSNSIKAYTRETYTEFLKSGDERGKAVRHQELFKEVLKQEIEVMGTLPVDYALVTELEEVARFARNQDVFLYTEQLKELEMNVAARAPKEFKENLVRIHREVYPPQVLKVGEEAVDAELIDIQGEKHHLREVFDGKKYVLLDFSSLGCGPCIMSEFEMIEAYKAQDKLEIVTINVDKEVTWKKHGQNEKVKWKNWNKGESDVVFRYCDRNATPYYILISPDKRIIWKESGGYPGRFMGMVDALKGLKQDNRHNFSLVVRKVEMKSDATVVHLRYYGHTKYWFTISQDTYLSANGKKYHLTNAEGIYLDEHTYPKEKVTDVADEYPDYSYMKDLGYIDFKLSYSPFETKPKSFDWKEGDDENSFVIRNIEVE